MKRVLFLTLILTLMFSSCYSQTEESKRKIEQETLIALKKWFENPSISNDLLDPAIIKQLQDSGRIENALKEKYEYPEWHFIEVANDIRNIKNQLIEKIQRI